MVWAAVVQHYIYKTSPCGVHANDCTGLDTSPLNVWIQTGSWVSISHGTGLRDWWHLHSPSYVLIAFSEIFASITGLEYAFTKAPKNMKSLVMAVFLFTSALASALGEAFVCELIVLETNCCTKVLTQSSIALADDPLLVWNYGVMGVLAFVTGILMWLSVWRLDAQEDDLNNIAEGNMVDPNKK